MLSTKPSQERYLLEMLEDWKPRAVHCQNCAHAKVSGSEKGPLVTCAKGHGHGTLYLIQLIRPKLPHGFRGAHDCPDFDSMGEGKDRYR